MLRRRALPDGGKGRWTSPDGSLIWSTHMGHDEPPYDANNPILRESQPVEERLHLTDAFTREAVDFIERHKSRPFFLYVAYNAVHSPLQGADRWMDEFSGIKDMHRRIFAAMVAHLDESVGRVLEKLSRESLNQKTIVFFLSDNGGPTRELTSSNAPLRGGKGSVYEGGLRIPFLMRWDGTLPAGLTYQKPVISTDIAATALALASIDSRDSNKLDGVNLIPFLLGDQEGAPHDTLFWRQGSRTALRRGDWKLVSPRSGKWELYHLAEDLGENNDLAKAQPSRLESMRHDWEGVNAEMAAPLWRRGR